MNRIRLIQSSNNYPSVSYKIILKTCFIFITFLFIFSCSKENKEKVDVPEPLMEIITNNNNCACEPFIDQYFWRGQTVYIFTCKGPTCLCAVSFFNEKGETLELEPGYTFSDFHQESKLIKNIWTCEQ
jgi:hypothetical protein